MWHNIYHLFHSRSRNLFFFVSREPIIYSRFEFQSKWTKRRSRNVKSEKKKRKQNNSKRKHMHLTANSIFIIDHFIRFHFINNRNWNRFAKLISNSITNERNVQNRQEFSSSFFSRFLFRVCHFWCRQSVIQFIFINALELKINCWNRHNMRIASTITIYAI